MHYPEDEAFVPPGVLFENISSIEEEQSLLEEKRICELSELSDAAAAHLFSLVGGGMPLSDALPLVRCIGESSASLHSLALEQSGEHLIRHASYLSRLDKALFVKLLLKRLSDSGVFVREEDFLSLIPTSEVFTYVKNLYADEAYEVFSEQFSDPRVFYSDTVRAAVLAVEEGRAGYCLLPLEEKGGVRLASIAEMLYRSELHIASVTPVYGYGEQTDLTYALVSRTYRIPPVVSEDDRYLELRISKETCALAELLLGAEAFGVAVYRIHSAVLEGEGGRAPCYSLVLRSEGKDFSALLAYLSIFFKDFSIVGIYSNLEA